MPLFVIERRFADQLDMTSDEVDLLEESNADEGVSWLFSFLSADRYRTYCLYEAPSRDAIIAAAARAGIPADVVTEVTRITPTLLTSPFRIAQDLLSLEGFTVQRLGWGIELTRGADRLALIFAVENLANRFYREHFQFAPSRGRSFTVGVNVGTR